MLINIITAGFIGLCGGTVVGSGVFGFITLIDIFPRISDRTNTASHIKTYEWCIILGGTIGNAISIFNLKIWGGVLMTGIAGFFFGIFIGCLALAIAEVLRVIPIFIQRSKLKFGLPWIIFMLGMGKGIGSFYQLYIK